MSKIQVLIQSEIESLLAKSKGYQTIEHNTTKGNLRETLLIEFFKKLIPSSLSISSGFICDCYGKISNQTDFIVYDKSILPSIFLDKNISMIPCESVYLTAEIKTTLRKKDLKQISEAREKLNTLKLANNPNLPPIDDFKIPTTIIAFENKVSEKALIEWINKENNIVSICIIDKLTLSRINNGEIKLIKKEENKPNYWETLIYTLQQFNYLTNTYKKRDITPLWEPYIEGLDLFREIHLKRQD